MDVSGPELPPGPGDAETPAGFLVRLGELRQWAGRPSLRRLRQLGGQVRTPSGDLVDALPPSTVSYLLRGEQLPRLDFVEAFVTACLLARNAAPELTAAAVADWQRAWRAVNRARPATPAGAASSSNSTADDAADASAGRSAAAEDRDPTDTATGHPTGATVGDATDATGQTTGTVEGATGATNGHATDPTTGDTADDSAGHAAEAAGEAIRDDGGEAAGAARLRQIPSDIVEFTGREEELRALVELAATTAPGITPVAVVEGMAGVGKTRLAVRAAHLLAPGYRRSLHVDLRGFAEDLPPAEPAVVLDGLLRLLGVPAGEIPHELSGRAALWRDRLNGTATLLMPDDAASVEQVTPLLPACPTCLVLVTTRRSLPVDGAYPVRLKPFTSGESVDLLARLAGPARIVADPAGTAEVAARCGELPLAVALAGRRLHSRETWTVEDLALRLRDTDRRLDELRLGGRTVDAVFSLSYQALSEPQRRLFRLLALHPGSTFTLDGAVALTGLTVRAASTALESLVDEYLLLQPARGRYAFHDLLRVYARERLEAETAEADRDRARREVLRWYLASVAAADRLIDPHHRHVRVDDLPAGLGFTSAEAALAWLQAEHANVVAAIELAAAPEPEIAWRLTAAFWDFLYLGKHWDDWVATHRTALAAAARAGSAEGQAWILNNLGLAYRQRNLPEAALDCYRGALRFREELGDRPGQVVLLDNLANAYDELGRRDEALDCYLRALGLAEQVSAPADLANLLNNLGEAYRRRHRYREAGDCLNRALEIQQRLGAAHLRFTLCSLGELNEDLRDPETAERFYRMSQEHARQSGDGWLEALLWEKLGSTAAGSGDLAEARERWRESAAAYARIGDDLAAARLAALAQGRS
jgi:tetratricopeptide (TPR) repeat protein